MAACLFAPHLVGCISPAPPGPAGPITSVSAASEPDALSRPRFAPDGPDAEEYGASKGLWVRVDYLSSQTFL